MDKKIFFLKVDYNRPGDFPPFIKGVAAGRGIYKTHEETN